MKPEMLRNYAVEASDLLTRWKRGEDVQDALAHQLRHVSAGLNTLQAEVVTLREDKARIDWLEKNRAGLNFADSPQGPHVWIHDFDTRTSEETAVHFRGKTYREAIDASRALPPTEPLPAQPASAPREQICRVVFPSSPAA